MSSSKTLSVYAKLRTINIPKSQNVSLEHENPIHWNPLIQPQQVEKQQQPTKIVTISTEKEEAAAIL